MFQHRSNPKCHPFQARRPANPASLRAKSRKYRPYLTRFHTFRAPLPAAYKTVIKSVNLTKAGARCILRGPSRIWTRRSAPSQRCRSPSCPSSSRPCKSSGTKAAKIFSRCWNQYSRIMSKSPRLSTLLRPSICSPWLPRVRFRHHSSRKVRMQLKFTSQIVIIIYRKRCFNYRKKTNRQPLRIEKIKYHATVTPWIRHRRPRPPRSTALALPRKPRDARTAAKT